MPEWIAFGSLTGWSRPDLAHVAILTVSLSKYVMLKYHSIMIGTCRSIIRSAHFLFCFCFLDLPLLRLFLLLLCCAVLLRAWLR